MIDYFPHGIMEVLQQFLKLKIIISNVDLFFYAASCKRLITVINLLYTTEKVSQAD